MYATMYAIYAYIGGFGGQMIGYIYIYGSLGIWTDGVYLNYRCILPPSLKLSAWKLANDLSDVADDLSHARLSVTIYVWLVGTHRYQGPHKPSKTVFPSKQLWFLYVNTFAFHVLVRAGRMYVYISSYKHIQDRTCSHTWCIYITIFYIY